MFQVENKFTLFQVYSSKIPISIFWEVTGSDAKDNVDLEQMEFLQIQLLHHAYLFYLLVILATLKLVLEEM